MYKIGKKFTFEAAHILAEADSLCCRNLHGHSYKVEVCASADMVGHQGVVVDFCHLSDIWDKLNKKMDHSLIVTEGQDVSAFPLSQKIFIMPGPATAENMARDIFHFFEFHLQLQNSLARICSVRVWETEKAWAEYSEVR